MAKDILFLSALHREQQFRERRANGIPSHFPPREIF